MYPQSNIVRYEVPAREGMPPVKVHVYDNADLRPEIMKDAEKKYEVKFGEDTLFVGSKGLFRTGGTCGSLGFLPEDRRTEIAAPARVLPRAHGRPIAGHLAQFAGVGKKLEWDVDQMKCTNVPEINRYVRREYRAGWEV